MEADGFLVLGAAETVVGLTECSSRSRTSAVSIGRAAACRVSARRSVDAKNRGDGRTVSHDRGRQRPDRVTFSRGYEVCIMAIDGTWRRDCQLNAISEPTPS